MQKYSTSWAQSMLDLNPDWMAIAVDECGDVHWTSKQFDKYIDDDHWHLKDTIITEKYFGYLGKFTYDGDWKDTLVVRKCEHYRGVAWKYCPKCGELLGSK